MTKKTATESPRKEGIIWGGSSEQYYLDQISINASGMKQWLVSPYHYIMRYSVEKDTPAMRFGRLAHAYFLQPHVIDTTSYDVNKEPKKGIGYQLSAHESTRTNAAKAELEHALYRNITIIRHEDNEKLLAMAEARRYANPYAEIIKDFEIGIEHKVTEVPIYWTESVSIYDQPDQHGGSREKIYEAPCKALLDGVFQYDCFADIAAGEGQGHVVVRALEYKTCASIAMLKNSFYSMHYGLATEWYLRGLEAGTDTEGMTKDFRMYFLFQETNPPYSVKVFEYGADPAERAHYREQINTILAQMADCQNKYKLLRDYPRNAYAHQGIERTADVFPVARRY